MKFIFNYQNLENWDDFVSAQTCGSFLQSAKWFEFQNFLGNKSMRLAVVDDSNNLLASCLLIQDNLSLGMKSLSAPYGPVVKNNLSFDQKKEVLYLLKKEIDKIIKKELLLLFEPMTDDLEIKKIFNELGFKPYQKIIQPRHTLILDITKEKEILLADMHQKTRYNINLATKKGVKIIITNEKKYLEEFYNLLVKTGKRQKFSIAGFGYFEKLLAKTDSKIYLAEYEGKIIAANVMIYFGKNATYLYGATSDENKNVMAPYLLQWQAICDAKENGFEKYDFWGVAGEKDLTDREKDWQGITRFKTGFNPCLPKIEYIGPYEYVNRPMFLFFYRLLQKIRKII